MIEVYGCLYRWPARLVLWFRCCDLLHSVGYSLFRKLKLWSVQPRAFPKVVSHFDGIYANFLPPGALVAHAMHEPMVDATQRDRELVARLAPEGLRLRKAQVVRVGGLSAANEAGLSGDITKMLKIPVATRGGDREDTLVDAHLIRRDARHGRLHQRRIQRVPRHRALRSLTPCVQRLPPRAWHHRP